MEKKKIKRVIAIAEKPVARNPVFLVKVEGKDAIHCEISQEIEGGPIALHFRGEPVIVRGEALISAELISQQELLKVISRLKCHAKSLENQLSLANSHLAYLA